MSSEPSRSLYVVRILARPSAESAHFEHSGGAYVNCWLDMPSEAAAVSRAETEVRESGWIPESVESIVEVRREDYGTDDDGREYFEQALLDGVVLVVNTFPNEPLESGDVN